MRRRAALSLIGILLLVNIPFPASAEVPARTTQSPARQRSGGDGQGPRAVRTSEFLKEAVEKTYGSIPEGFSTEAPGVPASLRKEVGLLYALGFSPRERVRWNGSLQRGIALRIAVVLGRLPSPETELSATYRDVHRASDRELVSFAEYYRLLTPLTRRVFGLQRVLQEEQSRQLLSALISLTSPPLTLPPIPVAPALREQRRVQPLEPEGLSPRERRRKRPSGADQDEPFDTAQGKEARPVVTLIPPSLRDVPHGELLQAIWQLIEERYLRSGEMDRSEMGYKAIEALVETLGDSYSTFYRPKEATDFRQELEGEIYGIGAQVEERDKKILVVTPLPGSPAEAAGVLPGDEIVAVDGESILGLSLRDAVMKIRGKVGTAVRLELRRNGAPLHITVIRAKIDIPEIVAEFHGNVLRVRLVQFGNTTLEKLRGILEEGIKQSPTGVILDLRNNPGGLLTAAVDVVSHFLPQGSVVAEIRTRDGTTTERTTLTPVVPSDLPVVVLVNRGSASASEIVAAALQEHERATVVGEKTFGKGTVQEVIQLLERSSEDNGTEDLQESALKITIANWFTPDGKQIEKEGVTPDIEIANEPGGRDDQLDRALQVLGQR